MRKIERALLSVSDKRGVAELAAALHRHGVELISSGGTASVIERAGLPVRRVADYTGSPEILDGRVKTLHPKIFGGLLARQTPEHLAQLTDNDIGLIDLVVVNLYPFIETVARGVELAEAVEQVDIGGPSLIRAAAKNHERVAVAVDPSRYERLIEELDSTGGSLGDELRRTLAIEAFCHTAAYDAAISDYLQRELGDPEQRAFPPVVNLQLERLQTLRYGENPHQSAALYGLAGNEAPYEQLNGRALSYNNLLDVDAAWALAQDLPDTAVCVIKHTNPCGAASVEDGDVVEAFRRARAGDPVSAFGGIVGCNATVTAPLARELTELFLEAVVAPDYTAEALQVLATKKRLRVVKPTAAARGERVWRSALGALLVQDSDTSREPLEQAKIATQAKPTAEQLVDLQFAWTVCKHVKSNAIVFVKQRQLVGVGAGQMSRVDAVKLAASKAALPLEGSVLGSDAFFPFRDGLDEGASAGAVAVVQPGGSKRDKEVIAAADERGVVMVLTGVRHFRH